MSKYIKLAKNGLLEEIDLHDGSSRYLNPDHRDINIENYDKVKDRNGNLVYVEKGSHDPFRPDQAGFKGFAFSQILAEQICEEVSQGAKLTELCSREGYPSYGQLSNWRRKFPWFDKKLRQARKDRAEYFFDKALEEIEQTHAERDVINKAKVVSEFYKNAAKLTDPESFTDKVEVGGNIGVQIAAVETGVRRPGDDGYNEEEFKDIKDSSAEDVIGDTSDSPDSSDNTDKESLLGPGKNGKD